MVKRSCRPALTADDLVELDLSTYEKRPAFERLLAAAEGPSLDLGAGLAYYSRHLLAGRAEPVVAVEVDFSALPSMGEGVRPLQGDALRLPFASGSLRTVLLADVLEHCPDDRPVLAEISRVLAPGGLLVLSVPSMEWGFPDFLTKLGIESVHDREGPEHHYRPGYRIEELRARLADAGLEVEVVEQVHRFGAKLLVDAVALAHLLVERGEGRKEWTWGTLLASPPPGLGLYRCIFPAVRGLAWLLGRLSPRRGFELVFSARRKTG